MDDLLFRYKLGMDSFNILQVILSLRALVFSVHPTKFHLTISRHHIRHSILNSDSRLMKLQSLMQALRQARSPPNCETCDTHHRFARTSHQPDFLDTPPHGPIQWFFSFLTGQSQEKIYLPITLKSFSWQAVFGSWNRTTFSPQYQYKSLYWTNAYLQTLFFRGRGLSRQQLEDTGVGATTLQSLYQHPGVESCTARNTMLPIPPVAFLLDFHRHTTFGH